ncbi:uncharacterized protein [Linepithema humile]|uniref:uncharacterized protein isoform X4 n=1 Tax=Linepithema humile TaxID=83485 RepID=UPI00351E5F7F
MSLVDILPNEIFLIIFDLCDVYTLLQLNSVCKRFYDLSNKILNKKSNRLLVTNEVSEKFRERDGSIRHWRYESQNNIKNLQQLKTDSNVYGEHVSNIEATTQHIVSSSTNLIKIQKNTLDDDESAEKNETIYNGKKLIQSISLDPTETNVAASTEESLLIYDINKNCEIMDKRINENTCSQLLWDDTHTILTLYKQCIKKMDIRTSEFVRTWNASFPNKKCELCCFSSDNLYSIITGTNSGTVLLWDQRSSDCIQTYSPNGVKPVYLYAMPDNYVFSVEFDSTFMYTIIKGEGVLQFYFKKEDDYNPNKERKKYFSKFI